MASLVNPSNINGNFPIAGQDNDSQGFRDNFTNIRNNFTFIKAEVEDLQSKAVLKSALIGSTLDNNFLGSQLKNTQLKNYAETLYDWGNTSGEIQLDLALGNVHKLYTDGSISINSVIKNWPSSLQYSRLLLYITISNTAHTLTVPNNITTSLEGLPGLRFIGSNNLVKFPESGTYVYEFSSVDSGTTVFVRELTRGNQLFRDPNFYFTDIGAGSSSGSHPSGYEPVTLKLNYGNVLSISGNIDSAKNGFDALSVKGGVSSYLAFNTSEGSNDSSLMRSAGFSVSRSRAETPLDGTAVTLSSGERVQTGDFIGYFNALGLTQSVVGSTYPFLQLGAVQFYANGSSNSIGGNIVIATKADGGSLTPAMIIDNGQNVRIAGNLTVDGSTTTINSTVLTVDDKNIIVASGVASATAANGSGIAVDTVFANIEYHGPTSSPAVSTYGGGDRWISNKSFAIANTATSTSSTTGALVVAGGLAVGENLNVGGTFGLTSSTNSTSKDTGAFVLTAGGLGVELNIVAGGMISANSTEESTTTTNGALVSRGGLGVTGKALIGGNLFVTSDIESTSSTIGAIITSGGVGIAKRLNVAGNVVFNSGTNSTYTMGSSGTSYTGALIVSGGAHVTKTLNIGNDAGDGQLIINVPTSALDAVEGTSDTGALIVGSVTNGRAGGMSVSGNFNLGSDANGTLWIRSQLNAFGTVINNPARSPYSLAENAYGSATVQGGVNIFGNLYVGQPHNTPAGGALTFPLQNTGNIYIQSGTPSISALTGALVIQKVRLPSGYNPATSPDGFSYGGLGMEGNLYAAGNVILGGGGNGDAISNVVVDATTVAVTTSRAALVVKGGVGIAGVTQTAGNIVSSSGTAGRIGAAGAKEGALVLTAGGAYIEGASVIRGNLVLDGGSASASTTTGALVIAGTGGLAVGGATNLNGDISIAGATAGGSGTGALRVVNGGASIGGNLFVQGATMPINAIGSSGVALLNATGTNQSVVNSAADITNLNFTPEQGKNYYFEAWIFHDATSSGGAAAITKGFDVTVTAIGAGGTGSIAYVVEQNITSTGALLVSSSATGGTNLPQTTASTTSITNLLAKITGTFYNANGPTNLKLRCTVSGSATATAVLNARSFLKWTKLN